jgi:hypothetical protein
MSSLSDLPCELIFKILNFCSYKNRATFTSTNNYFRSIGYYYGYTKDLVLRDINDYETFINIYNGNPEIIDSMTFIDIDNPIPLIPGPWPKYLTFIRCTSIRKNKKIEPPKNSKTEILQFYNIIETNININLDKLLNLQYMKNTII